MPQQINSGTAGTGTGTTEIELVQPVHGIHVRNDGAQELQIRIPAITGEEFDTVPPAVGGVPGERIFRNPNSQIKSFYVQTAAATTTWKQGIYMGNHT